ncbi:MAG: hypothetical protein KDC82_09025 [Bacteroidetes bacterium]|nr:hypothetical protein [Bacteroidota bacterium]
MFKLKEFFYSNLIIFFIILLGFGFRLLVATRGHNYDFDSFLIVARIVESGENVYANTARYNYGPIWFNVIYFLFQLSSKNELIFRYVIATFLSIVDIVIFIILSKRFNKIIAYLFLLNPMSIIITGYHNQFDNLALLLGMFAVNIIGENFEKNIDCKKILGLFVLGLSIITKHILFLFPLWLAIKQKGRWQKIFVILFPTLMFALSFTPYWQDGKQGIIQNVFLYKFFDNAYFFFLFIPKILQLLFSSQAVWVVLLIICAFVFRKSNAFDSLLLYTSVLVIASPAMANQYLAIVLPFVAVNLNPFTFLYTIAGSFFLLIDPDGLHVFDKLHESYAFAFYPLLLFLLLLGFIKSLWSSQMREIINRIYAEIKIQFCA